MHAEKLCDFVSFVIAHLGFEEHPLTMFTDFIAVIDVDRNRLRLIEGHRFPLFALYFRHVGRRTCTC